MKLDSSATVKAAATGLAGAVVLIVVNGVNYAVQDLKGYFDLGWQFNSLIESLGNFSTYLASVVVGFVIGILVICACKKEVRSLYAAVVLPAIAGLSLGALGFVSRTGYELIMRPIIRGWSISPINAMTTVLYALTDIAMMTGLVIAGGAICAVFLLKVDQQ